MDTIAPVWLAPVSRFISEENHVRVVKTLRLQLNVLDPAESSDLLDLVTDVDGVVAAIMDAETASLEVVVASDASALHVREQLRDVLCAVASA